MNYHIDAPQKFNQKAKELQKFIKKYNPHLLLERLTGRKIKISITVQHKPLKMAAELKNNTIHVDFNNEVSYIWLCICHELAHIFLQNPPWHKNERIKDIINKHKEIISKYRYTFQGAVEQILAILLQAACENEAGIRVLKWSKWELTFDCMGVRKIGKKFWDTWLKYLKNITKYKSIDEWIFEVLNWLRL